MFSTRGKFMGGPAREAPSRMRSRVSSMVSEERGGRCFCESRKAAISGVSGIALTQQVENFAIEVRVRLPGLRGHDAAIANGLLVDKLAAGEFGLALHVVVTRDV